MNNFVSISSWDTLPDIVLSNVFKHLEKKDRFNASLVNRTWYGAFKSPELWRKMKFKFPVSEKPIHFVNSSLGEYLRELEIECSSSETKPWENRTKETLHNFLDLLFILTLKSIILKKCIFTRVRLNSFWKDDWRRNKVVRRINEFLGKQSNMTHFSMESCEASSEVGIGFLNQLAKKNSRSLRNLHLSDFFAPRCDVLSSPVYRNLMGSFKSLVYLSINHKYIDSKVLELIVLNCSRSLKDIEIVYNVGSGNPEDARHSIPKDTWSWIRKEYPQLRVHVDFRDANFVIISSLDTLIPFEMMLHSFKMRFRWTLEYFRPHWTRGEYLDYDIGRINGLMVHVEHFRETLVELRLNFSSYRSFNSQILIRLVSSCPELKIFCFEGDGPIEIMEKLCEMQSNGSIHLSTCHFKLVDDTCIPPEIAYFLRVQELSRSVSQVQEVDFKLL